MTSVFRMLQYEEVEMSVHDPASTEKDFDERGSWSNYRPTKPDFRKTSVKPVVEDNNQSVSRWASDFQLSNQQYSGFESNSMHNY